MYVLMNKFRYKHFYNWEVTFSQLDVILVSPAHFICFSERCVIFVYEEVCEFQFAN